MKRTERQDGYFNEVVQKVEGKRHRDQETSGNRAREMCLINKQQQKQTGPNIQMRNCIYVKMWAIVLCRRHTREGRIEGNSYKTRNSLGFGICRRYLFEWFFCDLKVKVGNKEL